MAKTEVAAIGFRVKSGWAAAVLVSGPRDAPKVLDRSRVELSDAKVPESVQPYHAATGKEETNAAKIRQRVAIVKRAAARSVAELVSTHRLLAPGLRFAGLVVGSLIEPEAISNPHIRAHAYEGKLFRTVLEESLTACGLRCRVVREEDAYAQAVDAIGRPEAALKRTVDAMKRDVGAPWAANEKLAALAAWMMLAD
jgi:hypothetical protein